MESGSIAVWKLAPGDSFGAGDVYCSVETDKATMDFEAQDDGILAKILVAANSGDVNVGDPIMVIVQDKAHVAAFADFVVGDGAAAATAAPVAAAAVTAPTTMPVVQPAATTTTSAPPPPPHSATAMGGHLVASPLARMLAQQKGLDIATVSGTGPGGRILAADVKEFVVVPAVEAATKTMATAPAVTVAAAAAAPAVGGSSSMAAAVDNNDWALWSKQTVPHYYLTVDVRVDALQQLRASWSSSKDSAQQRDDNNNISLHACLIKAAAMSMKTVPAVNASYLGDVVRTYQKVDLQVIGDDENTVVVKDCANLGLAAIERIVSKTDDTKGGTDNVVLGTFSFCNLGMYGIASCAPIIRPPQAGALAVGAVETVLVPSDDKNDDKPYQSVSVLTATLSCDHRVVDGAVGAQWLATFKNYVEHPTTLLL